MGKKETRRREKEKQKHNNLIESIHQSS